MNDRVHIDVGGQGYTILRDSLENGLPSRLTDMYRSSLTAQAKVNQRIIVDRPADMFSAILAMYQTGELHIPMSSCPGAFMNELIFWDIPAETLSRCCYNRLQCFLDEQETLKQFRESLEDETPSKSQDSSNSRFRTVCYKLWSIVEYRKPTLSARIYFILSLFMVLLSIFVLAVKTDDNFRRAMTNCERLEYMISSGMENVNQVRETLERYCDNETLPNQPVLHDLLTTRGHEDKDYDYYTYFYFIYDYTEDLENKTQQYQDYSFLQDNFSSPSGLKSVKPKGKFVKVPNMKVQVYTLSVIEAVTIVFFTIDLVLRLFSCPSFKQYFLCVINITDALALVCTYVHLIVLYIYEHERYRDGWVDLLEYMQMLRALRLFRIVSNIRAGKVLSYSIRANFKDLSILALFLIAGMCTFASFFYIAEDKSDVKSILGGWYWAVVTMTTVGYGDISPKTPVGRLVACLCAITGVLLFALTLPIFANHFLSLYQHADTKLAFKKSRESRVPTNSDEQQIEKKEVFDKTDTRLTDTV